MPFGLGSGAGVIFGATGGVTEAVLRRLVDGHDAATMAAVAATGIRGSEGIKEATGIDLSAMIGTAGGNTVKTDSE